MERWGEQFLAGWFALVPCEATLAGDHRYDDRWGDLSPRGYARIVEFLHQQQLRLPPADQSLSYYNASRFLTTQLEALEHYDYYYDLGSLASTFQVFVQCYQDTVPEHKPARYRKFPQALQEYISVLRAGLRAGKVVSRRQVQAVITQCQQYAAILPFIPLSNFLRREYLPHATAVDGVGPERYARAVRQVTGVDIDLLELYDWGYNEIARVQELIARLPADPAPTINNAQDLFSLVRQWQLEAWELVQHYFHLPDGIAPLELQTNAVGDQTMYQASTQSSIGAVIYSSRYPRDIGMEMSTCFHEGFPGHHLQFSYPSNITPFERALVGYSVTSEGYALYAERLMEESGIYDGKPTCYLRGRYLNELVRCYRVVMDIGLHLGWDDVVSGQPWTFDRAVSALMNSCYLERSSAEHEVTRYLALPAQAICYKLGERVILHLRDQWVGDGGILSTFHHRLLSLGAVSLPALQRSFE
jgi:uncharacterized protein (DUF885 family)